MSIKTIMGRFSVKDYWVWEGVNQLYVGKTKVKRCPLVHGSRFFQACERLLYFQLRPKILNVMIMNHTFVIIRGSFGKIIVLHYLGHVKNIYLWRSTFKIHKFSKTRAQRV